MNRAVQIMTYVTFGNVDLNPVYKELKLLQVSKVCSLETGKFEFKRNKNLLPTQIGRYFEDSSTQEITHSHNLRSRNSNAPPRFISEKFTGEKSIQYKGAQIWNSLPTEIKCYLILSYYSSPYAHYK